jgi:hypothetical protein
MLFWKRKEVFMGASLEAYAAVRQKLAAAGIRYDIKAVNRFGSLGGGGATNYSRAIVSSMGQRTEYMNLFYVYVDKKNYDRAMQVINTPEK